MQKTVKVRIAVAVDPKGGWNSSGWAGGSDTDKMQICVETLDEGEARYWLEVELPVPEAPTVTPAVTPVDRPA